MWTTREWYVCLERMAAYERRTGKNARVGGKAPDTRGLEGDTKNTGLEQWIEHYTVRPRTERQLWFWLHHV